MSASCFFPRKNIPAIFSGTCHLLAVLLQENEDVAYSKKQEHLF